MIDFNKYSGLIKLWIGQGLIALIWLLLIPTDAGTFSTSRILLIVYVTTTIIAFILLAAKLRDVSSEIFSNRPGLYKILYFAGVISFFLPLVVILVLIKMGQSIGITYISYAERLAPLAFLISTIGLEWCLWHMVAKKVDLSGFRPIIVTAMKIFIFVAVPVVIFVTVTGFGLTPTRNGSFGNPATPLLEWQIILAVMVGVTAMLTESKWKAKQLDVKIFVLVYLSACLIWLADPLIPGFFATPPRVPNFEPYPFSDPLIYAQYSQSALVGEGFLWPEVPTRPLYVALLTWMYALVGQNYYHVMYLQVILLAFFPAVLYLLGRELGSRPLGLMLAVLAVLREFTANRAAPFAFNYSYSKLFMSEIPTALVLVFFTILAIRWIKFPKPAWYFLLMGGVLGIASLIRLQSAVLMAPLAVAAISPLWKQRRLEWLTGLALTTLGLVLTFSPWLIRNYYAADGFVVDNPISQSMTFARRWNGDTSNDLIQQFPDETTAQYVSRMNEIAINGFRREPDRILMGVTNHFFNNLNSSLHIFPIRDRIESTSELVWPSHAFWQTRARSPLLSSLYILLLVIGLTVAWTSHRWMGVLPFLTSLGYHVWTSLFLSSGDRFLIPIDWSWYLYYALGLLTLSKVILTGVYPINWISTHADGISNDQVEPFNWRKTVLVAALVFFAGVSLPLTELAFPEKYPALTQEQLSAELDAPLLEDEIILYGRAVYPRYYDAGDGEPETAKLGYGPSDEARLVFWLVGPDPGLVIFPLENAPEFFPNASDVWIIGTIDRDAFYARIVKVAMNGQTAIYGR